MILAESGQGMFVDVADRNYVLRTTTDGAEEMSIVSSVT